MSDQTQPMPEGGAEAAKPWEPPKQDEEFEFQDIASAPEWVDKNWAGYDNGPVLQVPNNLQQPQPYTTITARPGDTVKYKAGPDGAPGKFSVEPPEGKAPFASADYVDPENEPEAAEEEPAPPTA